VRASTNIGAMNRIVGYVRDKGQASMGEIEVQLSVSVWKQYELYRAYREFYQDIRLAKGYWRTLALKEPVVIPLVSQDSLSHTHTKTER